MTEKIIALLLIVAAVIHLLPVSGVLGATRLSALYGLPFDNNDLLILMRHRALLFGIVGGLLLCAAFIPAMQPLAIVVGLFSAVSFLLIAMLAPDYGPAIRRIVIADIIAVVCLLAAACATMLK